MRRNTFLTVDTETTMGQKVADFAAVVTDKHGTILTQCAVLVAGVYDNSKDELFHCADAGELWNKRGLEKRRKNYGNMLDKGARMMATPEAVNRWLTQAQKTYKPYLTAYNLQFDVGKSRNTGIDLDQFSDRQFCLWHASVEKWARTKNYRQFVLDNHLFNAPTKHGNASYKTTAEVMAKFVLNQPEMPDEPHTALEDILDYEIPILVKLLKGYSVKKCMNADSVNWRSHQLKDAFIAR